MVYIIKSPTKVVEKMALNAETSVGVLYIWHFLCMYTRRAFILM